MYSTRDWPLITIKKVRLSEKFVSVKSSSHVWLSAKFDSHLKLSETVWEKIQSDWIIFELNWYKHLSRNITVHQIECAKRLTFRRLEPFKSLIQWNTVWRWSRSNSKMPLFDEWLTRICIGVMFESITILRIQSEVNFRYKDWTLHE